MDEIVEPVRAAIAAGERITVHGDFDVDGVCATTIMVSTLRELGAECDWLIPDRIADGYGLSAANVEKLAERGTSLLITVDCGITAVEEVRAGAGARDGGDRHRPPPARRASCPTARSCIPKLERLSVRRRSAGPRSPGSWPARCARRPATGDGESDLDLVALATVADVVPLVGENRSLVQARAGRDAPRPGGPGCGR